VQHTHLQHERRRGAVKVGHHIEAAREALTLLCRALLSLWPLLEARGVVDEESRVVELAPRRGERLGGVGEEGAHGGDVEAVGVGGVRAQPAVREHRNAALVQPA
jgi:hypothetical protein